MEVIALWIGYAVLGFGGALLALWLIYHSVERMFLLASRITDKIGLFFFVKKAWVAMIKRLAKREREAWIRAKRNKKPRPLRCRVGWHKWQTTAFDGDFRHECERCGLVEEMVD